MKTLKISSMFLALLLTACGGGDAKKSQRAQLKEKEKELVELTKEVDKLRADVAVLDRNPRFWGEEETAKSVASAKVEKLPFVHSIEVLGTVDSDENVKVGSETGGNVTKVLVSVGDKVHKGQLLAETDNATMVQSLEEIKSQRAFANTIYEKQERLWKQNIGSEVQYLSAKNNLDALDKRMATINQQIAMSRITSPINGVVDAVDIKPGNVVAPGMPVIGIVNKNNLKLKAELAESYISKVKEGNRVMVNIPDAGIQFETRIKYSGQAINQLNRTFNVEMPIDKKYDNQLAPNMVAKLNIVDYASDSAIVLPLNVVQKDQKNKYVYLIENKNGKKIAVKHIVKTGLSQNGKIEIVQGLRAGDQVITSGFQSLQENDEISGI